MGGAAPADSGKKGGRKSLDNEMNLVPFIDLLSCLISFLLITAVWTQTSAVPARTTGNLAVDPPNDPIEHTIPIRVTLTERGYTLSLANDATEIPKTSLNGRVRYDTKQLTDRLASVKARIPDQRAVTMAAEDTVAFEDLAGTMDQIVAANLPDITVTPAVN